MELRFDLLVPYAYDANGNLTPPNKAKKGGEYFCPGCKRKLRLKDGEVRTTHFSHPPDNPCSSESVIHLTAKQLISQVIARSQKNKKFRPRVLRTCRRCKSGHPQFIPDTVVDTIIEYRLPSNHIADVALMGAKGPLALVEIRNTHAVEYLKALKLDLPWVELDAQHVLDKPLLWDPITDQFNKFVCKSCKKRETDAKMLRRQQQQDRSDVVSRLSAKFGVRHPWPGYEAAPTVCYRCKKEILVYTWPNHVTWPKRKPPSPMPPTLAFEYSDTLGRRYWANTCRFCKTIQGDYHLYNELDGPFANLARSDDWDQE